MKTKIDDELRAFDRRAEERPPDHPLVAARRVRGAVVFAKGGQRMGRVQNVALDKLSGRVAYAIIAYGGVLGIGRRYHAVPWRCLSYDTARRGYVTPYEPHDLERRQGFRPEALSGWTPPAPTVRDANLYPTAYGLLPPH